ncbi:hypothetical protein ACHAXS_006198, partial [Conticribra weissflogii]
MASTPIDEGDGKLVSLKLFPTGEGRTRVRSTKIGCRGTASEVSGFVSMSVLSRCSIRLQKYSGLGKWRFWQKSGTTHSSKPSGTGSISTNDFRMIPLLERSSPSTSTPPKRYLTMSILKIVGVSIK